MAEVIDIEEYDWEDLHNYPNIGIDKDENILELSFNSIIDKKFIHLKVNEFNQNLLKIKNKEKTFIDSRITILNAYEKFKKYYDSEQIKISTKNQTYVTLDLFLQLIGKNKFIEDYRFSYQYLSVKIKNNLILQECERFAVYEKILRDEVF